MNKKCFYVYQVKGSCKLYAIEENKAVFPDDAVHVQQIHAESHEEAKELYRR